MTTLSPTKARSNLTAWLKKAAAGEDIGILFGDKVIALRPVEVESTDYAEREYGVTKEELKRATDISIKKANKTVKPERAEPTTVTLKPSLKIEWVRSFKRGVRGKTLPIAKSLERRSTQPVKLGPSSSPCRNGYSPITREFFRVQVGIENPACF